MALMNKRELFKLIKEENKNQEALLNSKLIEGNEQLKEMLHSIKVDHDMIESNHRPSEALSRESGMMGNENVGSKGNERENVVETFANDIDVYSRSNRDKGNDYHEPYKVNNSNQDGDGDNEPIGDDNEEEGCIKISDNSSLNKANSNYNYDNREYTNQDKEITNNREDKAKDFTKTTKQGKGKSKPQPNNRIDRRPITIKHQSQSKEMVNSNINQYAPNMINSINSLSKEDSKTLDSQYNNMPNMPNSPNTTIKPNIRILDEDKEYIAKERELRLLQKQYNKLSNQIALLQKQKDILLDNEQRKKSKAKGQAKGKGKGKSKVNKQHKLTYIHSHHKPFPLPGEKQAIDHYPYTKTHSIAESLKRELFKDIGTRKTLLNEFVDKVAQRSLYLYNSNNCQTCSKLLSQGKSTQMCPKCH